jgi:4-hydroxybenzoate polyprenyltransferase
MLKHKGKLSLIFFVLIVVSLLVFPGLLGPILASIFILATLVLYAIPDWDARPEKRRRFTPENKQLLRNALLGIGLGLTGSVLLLFVPRPWSWIIIGAVAVAAVVYAIKMAK